VIDTGRIIGSGSSRRARGPRCAGTARSRWDAWEANARLPEARRRPLAEPVLDRAALDGLHELLTEELARLDGARRPAG
jgi:hypothetical protein